MIERSRGWILALLVGLALFTALLAWQGVDTVLRTLALAGWEVLWLAPLFALPGACAVAAWRILFPRDRRPGRALAAYATWIGFGVNWLLPVAQVGGEVVKVRLLHVRDRGGVLATATVVADKTIQAATQAVFALLGAGLLGLREASADLLWSVLAAVGLLAVGIYAFYRLQLAGVFGRVAGVLEDRLDWAEERGLALDAGEVDDALRSIYADVVRVGGSFGWRMAFRLLLTAEVLLVLGWLGHPVGVVEALIIESLAQAARAAAFLVPAGLGAQEGGIILVGLALGLPPEAGIALSLAKRARELAVGLPALLAWQLEEARGRPWTRDGLRSGPGSGPG